MTERECETVFNKILLLTKDKEPIYRYAYGSSSQAQKPAPTAPIEITDSILAGTYQVSYKGEIYEIVLNDNMRGIGTYRDTLQIDFANKKAYFIKKCGKAQISGNGEKPHIDATPYFRLLSRDTSDWCVLVDYCDSFPAAEGDTTAALPKSNNSLCTHFYNCAQAFESGKSGEYSSYQVTGYSRWYFVIANSITGCPTEFSDELTTAQRREVCRNYLIPWFNENKPKIVYKLLTPQTTKVKMTKVSASSAPILNLTEG